MATLKQNYEFHRKLHKKNAVSFYAFQYRIYKAKRSIDKAIRTAKVPNDKSRQDYKIAKKNVNIAHGYKSDHFDQVKLSSKCISVGVKTLKKQQNKVNKSINRKRDAFFKEYEYLRSEHEKLLTSQLKENQAMFI